MWVRGEWAASVALLESIPGLGPTTIAWIVVATMNFTVCATPQAAAYAGLAPLAHESGTSARGRARLRSGWPCSVAEGGVLGDVERGTAQSAHSDVPITYHRNTAHTILGNVFSPMRGLSMVKKI
ncbi:hypothetical protein Hgul01_05302 [Herpetosiphon gulosus]|uniref:Transposase IS116/IS110/IS902 C-terminal domain-containing protein n=1 Tax=Herpetosiphon gulosus TaxID=1973496 RepID=A0ABP9X7V6_9CHLR